MNWEIIEETGSKAKIKVIGVGGAPPTPMTLIFALLPVSSIISQFISYPLFLKCHCFYAFW